MGKIEELKKQKKLLIKEMGRIELKLYELDKQIDKTEKHNKSSAKWFSNLSDDKKKIRNLKHQIKYYEKKTKDNNEMETWKAIKGYPNYEVSNLGNVRNKKGNVLKPEETERGYLRVNLFNNGKVKHHKIHRLVASTFIPNENNFPQINHKDENKKNNKVDNLEWCTNWYNSHYDKDRGVQYDQQKLF